MASKFKAANRRLSPDNAPALNREFYSGMPHGYFAQRLENLAVVGGKYDELQRITDEGITWGKLTLGAGPLGEGDRERDARAVEQFVLIESEVLLHHAAETLLRLYFAHAHPGNPPCPWLAMAERVNFDVFKRDVRARFLADASPSVRLMPEQRAELCRVFRGFDDPERLQPSPPSQELWDESLVNINQFMRYFAQVFLDDAPLYNPTKHGMAITVSRDASLAIDGRTMALGPAMTVLEVVDQGDRTAPKWHRTTRWFDFERHAAFTFCAIRLTQQLWTVGAARYAGTTGELFSLFDRPLYSEVNKLTQSSHTHTRVSMGLIYDARAPQP